MNDFPWYEEVMADSPITQGDLIESCPVLAFDQIPELPAAVKIADVLAALEAAYGVLPTRVVVMTQACDLAQAKATQVTLCPIRHVSDYKQDWEAALSADRRMPKVGEWQSRMNSIKNGRILNLCLLNGRRGETAEQITIPHQIVDFHEVFSLPLDFLAKWVTAQGHNRLRLLPPYREHLSQSFARYFMRVGLPQPIDPIV